MKIIDISELPEDNLYYRSSSQSYEKYLELCGLNSIDVGNGQFGRIRKILSGKFCISKFERIDLEPDIDALKKNGFIKGLVIWVPYSRKLIPSGWKKLCLNTHFTTTGFTIIDNLDYKKKWSDRARRAIKRFLNNHGLEIRQLNKDDFQKIYKEAKIFQPYKKDFINYHNKISFINEDKIRNFVCFLDGEAIAGLAVHDYNDICSVHLVSFLTDKAKKYQAGTGLIDYWFTTSIDMGIKYINFDHLRDKYMARSQKGYTEFKENFIEYKVVFKDSYFKFILN